MMSGSKISMLEGSTDPLLLRSIATEQDLLQSEEFAEPLFLNLDQQDDDLVSKADYLRQRQEAKVDWYVKLAPLKPSSECFNEDLSFYCDTFFFKRTED